MVVGVIIAAGKGTRINPLNTEFQKCMLPVLNKPILEHQIEFFKGIGVREIVLVVGFLKEGIKNHFGDGKKLGVSIKYAVQKNPEGLAKAVELARPFSRDESIVVFLGDIFLELNECERIRKIVLDRNDSKGYVVVKREKDINEVKKNFSVEASPDGKISRVIEKPRIPPNNMKGCGLYIFPKEIYHAIEMTPRSKLRNEFELTDSIQKLVDMGVPTYVLDIVENDINITVFGDVFFENMRQLKKTGQSKIIGVNCSIPKDTKITDSVIGDNVFIEKPIKIENTVIFPNSKIYGPEDLKNYVITPKQKIFCNTSASK